MAHIQYRTLTDGIKRDPEVPDRKKVRISEIRPLYRVMAASTTPHP